MIEVMRLMNEIGHVDINTEVSLLSSYLPMPRQGHLEAVLHKMSCLNLKHKLQLAFNLMYPDIDPSNFGECDYIDFYEGTFEAIPTNALSTRGKEVDLHIFIDSDCADNRQTRQSRTSLMIYMTMLLTNWYSKKAYHGDQCLVQSL